MVLWNDHDSIQTLQRRSELVPVPNKDSDKRQSALTHLGGRGHDMRTASESFLLQGDAAAIRGGLAVQHPLVAPLITIC